MRIAIMGAGGLGGAFGGLLDRAGEDVSFVARGAHLEAIQSRGLTIKSPGASDVTIQVTATDDPAEVGPVDLIVFGVKLSSDLVDRHLKLIDQLPATVQGSMLTDLLNGRRLELESFNGTVVRLGHDFKVPTPLNFAVYAALKPYVDGAPARPRETS